MKTENDTPKSNAAAVMAIAEQTADPLMNECQRLERQVRELVDSLTECAGYIASVNTERTSEDAESGETWALQTLEWAQGAYEIAVRANAVLEAYDAGTLGND
jgi:hypothetical protein